MISVDYQMQEQNQQSSQLVMKSQW